MKHFDTTDYIGASCAAAFVAVQKIYLTLITNASLNWMVILETIVLSALGATVGFLITELWKWAKRRIIKRFFPVVVIGLAISSCVTPQRCIDKFGELKPHTITLHDTIVDVDTIYTPADSLHGSVNIDSLIQGKLDSLVHTSSSQNLSLKLWYDKYTRLLNYKAELKPDTVVKIEYIPVTQKGECPPVVVVDPEKSMSKLQIMWRRWEQVSAWLMLIGFILIAYRLIK